MKQQHFKKHGSYRMKKTVVDSFMLVKELIKEKTTLQNQVNMKSNSEFQTSMQYALFIRILVN